MEMGFANPQAKNTAMAMTMPESGVTPRSGAALWPLLVIVALGALPRLALWEWFQGKPPLIEDEQDYNILASNLVRYHEYAFEPRVLTSLRPPLYPAMVAVVYGLFGIENFQAVRLLQAALSLLNVVVIYSMGRSLFSHRIGLWASGLYCFYPSLLGYNNLLLTEVLFTLLLCVFCALAIRALQKNSLPSLLAAALVLGLTALTRSVVWLFPPVFALFLLLAFRGGWWRRLVAAGAFVAAFAATVAPWAIRNTRVQQTFVVIDVMGGRNLMMGNYQYTPLYRSWATIGLGGEQSWIHEVLASSSPEERGTQGKVDKLAMRQGLRFMAAHPGLTAQRALVKFFDFWGLERELVAGGERGVFGTVPGLTLLLLTLVVCGSYAFTLFAGVFGATLAPPTDLRPHLFLLLLIAFVCGLHTLAFGHSRYHLPLMPLVLLYAASAVVHRHTLWEQRWRWTFWLACGICTLFVGGWVWMIVAVDGGHILNLMRSFV
jgi:4-amino-4-deoxy-L-arabinose transferase-like glycosyltransferase